MHGLWTTSRWIRTYTRQTVMKILTKRPAQEHEWRLRRRVGILAVQTFFCWFLCWCIKPLSVLVLRRINNKTWTGRKSGLYGWGLPEPLYFFRSPIQNAKKSKIKRAPVNNFGAGESPVKSTKKLLTCRQQCWHDHLCRSFKLPSDRCSQRSTLHSLWLSAPCMQPLCFLCTEMTAGLFSLVPRDWTKLRCAFLDLQMRLLCVQRNTFETHVPTSGIPLVSRVSWSSLRVCRRPAEWCIHFAIFTCFFCTFPRVFLV